MTEFHNTVEFPWKGRDGVRRGVTIVVPDFQPATILAARQMAKEKGYPGHEGGWWNWSVDDNHDRLMRLNTFLRTPRGRRIHWLICGTVGVLGLFGTLAGPWLEQWWMVTTGLPTAIAAFIARPRP